VITIHLVLKLNLPCTSPPLQVGSLEPSQGGGLTSSRTVKVVLPSLPWLQDVQGHRKKTNRNRAILGRTHNKNDDKVRWERLISGHYSCCNVLFLLGFFSVFGLSDWSQLNYSLWKQAKRDLTNWKMMQLMAVLVRRKKIT